MFLFQTSVKCLEKDVVEQNKRCLPNGWTYIFFTDDDILDFFKENPDSEFPLLTERFQSFKKGTNKSDFFRLYFLYKKGGIFLDSDASIECSLSELTRYDFFTVQSGAIPNTMFNGLIGSVQGHPIVYNAFVHLYYTEPDAYEKVYFMSCYNLNSIVTSRIWPNIKIFKERNICNTFVWEQYDPENNMTIGFHYPFTKLVPTNYLRVYQWANKVRLGSYADGGYVIAPDVGLYDYYISCGIGGDESFTDQFIETFKIDKASAFDGTLAEKWTFPNTSISHVMKNIGTVCDDKTTDLSDILGQYKNVFLKMDIEGTEFDWIWHTSSELINNIKQMVIEFHGINDDTWNVLYTKKRACFEKLEKTHYIVHAHGNNWAGRTYYIPDVIEITFLRKDVFSSPPKHNLKVSDIDKPNNPNAPDYFLGFPPFIDLQPPTVTLTITTCKRLDNFCRTMDALIKHCKDLCDVLVVDDSSAYSDRIEMQKRYPFITLVSHDKKSHAHSLNIIRDVVKTDYILMFEDDWICHKDFSIHEVIKYMQKSSIDNLRLNSPFGDDLVQVHFSPDKMVPEYKEWCKQRGYIFEHSNVGEGWPGFSLNPTMLHRSVLDEPFDENIPSGFMEFDYAIRHVNKKWYGKDICGLEHNDGGKCAYVLNNTNRWWDKSS